jgi:hypothetical protein
VLECGELGALFSTFAVKGLQHMTLSSCHSLPQTLSDVTRLFSAHLAKLARSDPKFLDVKA